MAPRKRGAAAAAAPAPADDGGSGATAAAEADATSRQQHGAAAHIELRQQDAASAATASSGKANGSAHHHANGVHQTKRRRVLLPGGRIAAPRLVLLLAVLAAFAAQRWPPDALMSRLISMASSISSPAPASPPSSSGSSGSPSSSSSSVSEGQDEAEWVLADARGFFPKGCKWREVYPKVCVLSGCVSCWRKFFACVCLCAGVQAAVQTCVQVLPVPFAACCPCYPSTASIHQHPLFLPPPLPFTHIRAHPPPAGPGAQVLGCTAVPVLAGGGAGLGGPPARGLHCAPAARPRSLALAQWLPPQRSPLP